MEKSLGAPILILYTGGTIGMMAGIDGWEPAAGFEPQIRAAQAQHHQDPGSHAAQTPLPPWTYLAMAPPIDSANMTQQHWLAMRTVIVDAVTRGNCSGVLILHGTDTLAYTAAALGFLLLGLPVPVCVTGSMYPASQADTDAWGNLFAALHWLRHAPPGGVYVFFDGKAFPGVRVTKRFSHRRDAFAVMRQTEDDGGAAAIPAWTAAWALPPAHGSLDYRVVRQPVSLGVLPLYPGFDAAALDALLRPGVRGAILELYGSGTGPADDVRFLDGLRQARARGVVLVGISQCPCGIVDSAQYAAASRLTQAGVLPGGSMTREAALGKLFGLLGAGLSADAVRQWWPQDLCGEWGLEARPGS